MTSPGGPSDPPTRVLLVDDDEPLRRAMARALSAAGYVVVEAEGGRTAVEFVFAETFAVIVTDITMPDMDGITLLRTIRERDLDVPVILITGNPDVASATAAVRHGAFGYLVKPFQLDLLRDTVAKAEKLHAMARMKREALELLGGPASGAGDRAGVEATFDRALETLWMAYQPILRARDGTLYGYEALLRSREPALPHPGAVIEAAEKLGKLNELGRTVRARAAAPLAGAPLGAALFVNLHARDLLDDELLASDAPLLRIADRVVLEITERVRLDEVDDPRARIAALRRAGFRIAVDDLGAGYAGLTSFATLEPEIVKLDISLVRDVHESQTKQKLVRSMTTLCREMGMLVVAEGVELVAERNVLVDLGCDLLQGYLFAKPGPAFPDFAWP